MGNFDFTQIMEVIQSKDMNFEHIQRIEGEKTIAIQVDVIRKLVRILMAQFGIFHLSTITAQQLPESIEEIAVFYHFWNGDGLTIQVILKSRTHQLPSITDMIPGADFYEREVAEMYGVQFSGRETPQPLLLPDDWDQGPPMLLKENDEE